MKYCIRNTYKLRQGQDSVGKHFILSFFFRTFLIIYYESNTMYNEMWALLSMKQQENIYPLDKFHT